MFPYSSEDGAIIRPVQKPHKVTSGYGWRRLNGKRQFHDGIDYINKDDCRMVFSMADGVVVHDQDDYNHELRWMDRKHSAGNMLIIKHKIKRKEYYIRYLHLEQNDVSKGDIVNKWDTIGTYGDVGYSFGAHLHIDMFDMDWQKIDPTEIILNNLK